MMLRLFSPWASGHKGVRVRNVHYLCCFASLILIATKEWESYITNTSNHVKLEIHVETLQGLSEPPLGEIITEMLSAPKLLLN